MAWRNCRRRAGADRRVLSARGEVAVLVRRGAAAGEGIEILNMRTETADAIVAGAHGAGQRRHESPRRRPSAARRPLRGRGQPCRWPTPDRFAIMATLLQGGYAVTSVRRGRRRVSPTACATPLVVLGRFDGAPPDARRRVGDVRRVPVFFRDIDGVEPAAVAAIVGIRARAEAGTRRAGRVEAVVPGHRLRPLHELHAVPDLLPVRRLRRLDGEADPGAEPDQLQDRLPGLLAGLPGGRDPVPEVQDRADQRRRGQRRGHPPREDEGRHLGAARRRHLRGAAGAERRGEAAVRAERDDKRALEERRKCLTKLQEQLDIPPEVLAALPASIRSARRPSGRMPRPRCRATAAGGAQRHDGAAFAMRMLRETDPRLLWKFAFNFGYKGMRSVQRFKKRLKQGEHFPPFLYLSIINSCNLRCQGCWVDVDGPQHMIDAATLRTVISDAKKHGNSFFGILGGEPFMHPELLDILGAHPDCYFQIFTNGQLITDEVARELRRLGNATPLISIEGTEVVSDERRGRMNVLDARSRAWRTAAAQADHRRGDQRLPDEHRRPGQRGVAARADRARRALRLVPHLPPGRRERVARSWRSRPDQVLHVRRFVVGMRAKLPIAIVDAYWDDKGQALCPMATGISHHIGPVGRHRAVPDHPVRHREHPRPRDLYDVIQASAFLKDFRETAAKATRGCVVLERPTS